MDPRWFVLARNLQVDASSLRGDIGGQGELSSLDDRCNDHSKSHESHEKNVFA